MDVRERLLEELTEEILSHRESLLDDTQNGIFSFEFQEIEDRYCARLAAVSSLLDQLEERQPSIQNRVEQFQCPMPNVRASLQQCLEQYPEWDLAAFEVLPLATGKGGDDAKGGQAKSDDALVIVVMTRDEYAE